MFQDLPTSAGLDCHGLCTVASSNSHFLGVFWDPLLVMSTHTLKELPLLPTTQPKPTVSLRLLEVYFEERCHPCRCSRQEFSIQNTLPEFRCVGLRQPHSCKRRTTYFFCFTHHVYSQGGPFFVLLVSFVAPFCGRSFFKLSRSRPFSCNVLSWLAPTATFVHTAGGSVYGSSTLCPHPFKSSEFVRATGRDPHPQRRRRRTANLTNPRPSLNRRRQKSPMCSPQHPTRARSLHAPLHRCCKVLTRTGASHGAATRGSRSPRQEPSAQATLLGGGG